MTRRQTRIALGGAVMALLALLGIFAAELASSQSKSRHDVESRLRERARVSAALTQSLFASSSSTAQAENVRLYGTARVTTRTIAAAASRGRLAYAVLLAPNGTIMAASPNAPAPALRLLQAKPEDVRQVLGGQPYALSNVLRIGPGGKALELAQAFNTPFGRRVLVSGFSPQLLYAFLGGYLKQVPNVSGGHAYVLDASGAVIGSPQMDLRPGQKVNEPGLAAAVVRRTGGAFGHGRWFAASAVQGTPWHVVVSAAESKLFASVRGASKWVPWLIFVAFALAAMAALALLGRVLRSAAKLSVVNRQLEVTNRTLERRATDLSRSNAELEQFASIASHDLQEPLRKVRTFSEQLKLNEADRLSDEGRDYLKRMVGAATRMQALIEDLLKFSRVATQGRPFVDVDLTAVAREVVADLEAVIDESGATVEVGDLPTLAADPLQMRQLLQNLVSNALKFCREGVPPEVRIDGRVSGRFAEVEVIDNGIGFDPEYATRIFRVFERLHGHASYSGTGIGLALCRKIAERHGGTIVAESTPGEGATFVVMLPFEHSDEPPSVLVPRPIERKRESSHAAA